MLNTAHVMDAFSTKSDKLDRSRIAAMVKSMPTVKAPKPAAKRYEYLTR